MGDKTSDTLAVEIVGVELVVEDVENGVSLRPIVSSECEYRETRRDELVVQVGDDGAARGEGEVVGLARKYSRMR